MSVVAWRSFLEVFSSHGVRDVLGLDGDYVDRDLLRIPKENFLPVDLERPLPVARTFDLVLCLEVADDLAPEVAPTFVKSLVDLGPVIIFSAAIPFQGGQNQKNEQWPSYWAEHFRLHKYVAVDFIRRRIWNNEKVEWWYAQNMLAFVREDRLNEFPILAKYYEETTERHLSLVHPTIYSHYVSKSDPNNWPLRAVLKALPRSVSRALIRRVLR